MDFWSVTQGPILTCAHVYQRADFMSLFASTLHVFLSHEYACSKGFSTLAEHAHLHSTRILKTGKVKSLVLYK